MPKKTKPKTKNSGRHLPGWGVWASIGLIVIVAALVYYFGRVSQKAFSAPTPTPSLPAEISVDDAFFLFGNKSVFFLDVRPAADWKVYHIDLSVSIPSAELSGRLSELPRTGTIVIVDKLGGEPSQQALSILQKAGFHSVTSMAGGIEAWVQRGLPIDGTAPY